MRRCMGLWSKRDCHVARKCNGFVISTKHETSTLKVMCEDLTRVSLPLAPRTDPCHTELPEELPDVDHCLRVFRPCGSGIACKAARWGAQQQPPLPNRQPRSRSRARDSRNYVRYAGLDKRPFPALVQTLMPLRGGIAHARALSENAHLAAALAGRWIARISCTRQRLAVRCFTLFSSLAAFVIPCANDIFGQPPLMSRSGPPPACRCGRNLVRRPHNGIAATASQ